MKAAAASIVPGTTIFLFNVTTVSCLASSRLFYPAIMNIEPAASPRTPRRPRRPFQYRFEYELGMPSAEDTDPLLNDVCVLVVKGA
jgi:hypothetical protein